MQNEQKAAQKAAQKPALTDGYKITVGGHLDARWQEWFDGLIIMLTEDGNTTLSGPVQDQAALYGILNKIYSLSLKLISVNPHTSPPAGEDS